MFFDPVSTWLVTVLVNGATAAKEKWGDVGLTEYEKECVAQRNQFLNDFIRREKKSFGLACPDDTLGDIKRYIDRNFTNSYLFEPGRGQIVIKLDNQDYIIELLDACAKLYGKYSTEEAQKKEEWYRNAAIEARKRKEQYITARKEARIREAREAKQNAIVGAVFLVVGLAFLVFIICCLS